MEKQQQKYISYDKGRFYLNEPPVFGTITSKLKNETFFFPMKKFNSQKFQENFINFDVNRKWKESFYISMNSYDDGDYLTSNRVNYELFEYLHIQILLLIYKFKDLNLKNDQFLKSFLY